MLVFVLHLQVHSVDKYGDPTIASVSRVVESVHAASALLDRYIASCDVLDYEVEPVEIP